MNLLQCPTISERDLKRTEKYHRYWTMLARIEGGDKNVIGES
ncbi:MAG: hypothetical protein ACI8W8_001454 [Rhodothermales bacterium]|jgi:hypothetical protein